MAVSAMRHGRDARATLEDIPGNRSNVHTLWQERLSPLRSCPITDSGMNSRAMIWIGLFVCSTIGGFIPWLWGGSVFSLAGLVCSTMGAFIGIWLGFKVSTSL